MTNENFTVLDDFPKFEQKNQYQWATHKLEESDDEGYNYFLGLYAYPNDDAWRVAGCDAINKYGENKGFEPYLLCQAQAEKTAMRICLNHMNKKLMESVI